jgi:predicted esterase
MYENCKIIGNKGVHKYSLLMLHPMYSDASYFNDYIGYCTKNYNNFISHCKIILPQSPLMTIDYPNNKQYNIKSWYNYYTCYNNLNKVDKISRSDFNEQTRRLVSIINNEATILNSYKNIFIIGVSQGGTLLFNILNKLPNPLGGLFCIKSLYMYKYIKLKKNRATPLFFYSGTKDEIYNLEYQKKCSQLLERKYKLVWKIVTNLDHYAKIEEEYKFVFGAIEKLI